MPILAVMVLSLGATLRTDDVAAIYWVYSDVLGAAADTAGRRFLGHGPPSPVNGFKVISYHCPLNANFLLEPFGLSIIM